MLYLASHLAKKQLSLEAVAEAATYLSGTLGKSGGKIHLVRIPGDFNGKNWNKHLL